MTTYNDYPIAECQKRIDEIFDRYPSLDIKAFQKFSCEKCGERLGMDIPNAFFVSGTCDQCGHETDILKRGCNYTLVMEVTPRSKKEEIEAFNKQFWKGGTRF